MIALNSPLQPDLARLGKYLDTISANGWHTNFGPLHDELTARLEEYLGVENLLLVANGTLALQVAAAAIACQSVITPAFGFVATACAFLWRQQSVAFMDIERSTYNLSTEALSAAFSAGAKADTIVPTHVYGNPCDVVTIDRLAAANNRKVIYDAAHAFGVKVGGKSVLSFGEVSTLSFHATKVFHTGEGGAVVFRDKSSFDKAKAIINFGIDPGYGVVETGTNAKLNEYQAAIGLANLDVMDEVLDHRASLFHQYRQGLADIVEMPRWRADASCNGAYMPIHLPSASVLKQLMASLGEKGIGCRHYFAPSLDEVYPQCANYGSSNSVGVAAGIVCLPLHAYMSAGDVARVVDSVKQVVR